VTSFAWPSTSSGVATYANVAALPVTATSGDLAVTVDTGNLYEYSGSAWRLLASPGSPSGIGAFSSTPTAQGLSISGGLISLDSADATHPGGISVSDWNTFNNKQSALTIGNLTDAGTDGITVTGGTGSIIGSGVSLSQHVADVSHNGYLSSTDWSTFNNKQSSLTIGNLTDAGTDGITVTGGSGSVIGSGTSLSQHVADTTHNGYLSSTDWNTFNGKQASGTYVTSISVASSNGFAGSSSGGATPALTLSTSITGILKGNGTAISAATSGTDYSLGTSALSTGILKSTTTTGALTIAVAGDFPTLNQNTSGTAANVTGTVAIANGGTGQTTKAPAFDALSPMTTGGDIIYGGASGTGTRLANGTAGQFLISNGGTSAPSWSANTGIYVSANSATGSVTSSFTTTQWTSVTKNGITDSGSGVFTIVTPGLYFISYNLDLTATLNAVGDLVQMRIFQNNATTLNYINFRYEVANASSTNMGTVTSLVRLALNDTIRGQVKSGATSTPSYAGNDTSEWLQIFKIAD